MHKIKVIGMVILVLSIILAFVFNYISQHSSAHNTCMSIINQQKSYTQEISKSVLYLSKNRGSSSVDLEKTIKSFLLNMTHKKENTVEHDTLVHLWELFYLDVEKFRTEQLHTTAYSTITMDKLVNSIYMQNQQLIVAFNHFIHKKQMQYNSKMQWYKNVGYGLLAVVVLLLLYLFTQIHSIMTFIQKFSHTSKSIIQKASIKGLKPLKLKQNDKTVQEATENFNLLVEKINDAIIHSEASIEHTILSLEEVENKIEDLISLVAQMQEENKELLQKEDAVIDSLEILMTLTNQLKSVKTELDKLTSTNNYH